MKRIAVLLTTLLVLSSTAFALDGSILESQVTISGEQTIQITNITVNGLPITYWAEFTWDSSLLAFKLLTYGSEQGSESVVVSPFAANAVDGSIINAKATITGQKSIRITNITIFGLPGVYWGEFTWSPQLLVFKLVDYGEVWREVQVDADYDMDDIIDEVETFFYDANGNWIRQESNDLQDTDDVKFTFFYDASGRLTRDEVDVFPFSSINEVGTYTYDANGRLMSRQEDSGNNGITDAIETYTFDANSRLTGYAEDSDNNGSIDVVETYTYDANGNLIRGEADTDNNGSIDEVFTFTYDANGNAITMQYDADNNGTIDATGTFTHDVNGNLSKEEYDNDGNGSIDERYTHRWVKGPCWVGGLDDILPDMKVLGRTCN